MLYSRTRRKKKKKSQTGDFSLEWTVDGPHRPAKSENKNHVCLRAKLNRQRKRARPLWPLPAAVAELRAREIGKGLGEEVRRVTPKSVPSPPSAPLFSWYNRAIIFQLLLAPVRELTRGRHRVLSADVHWRQSQGGRYLYQWGAGLWSTSTLQCQNLVARATRATAYVKRQSCCSGKKCLLSSWIAVKVK